MCMTLWYEGEEIETVSQLRALMPNITKIPCYSRLMEDCCLCGVDTAKTCQDNGFLLKISDCYMYGDLSKIAESNASNQGAGLPGSAESRC